MRYETTREAAEAWVREFDAIPTEMILALINAGYDYNILCGDDCVDYYAGLPMWGTMWSFHEQLDNDWLDGRFGEPAMEIMEECGFTVIELGEWGYFFGIDGAGYDFYESHWIPLYKARGLHWSDEDEE